MEEPKNKQPQQPAGRWSPQHRFSLVYLLVTIAALWLWQAVWQSFALVPLRYDQFKRLLVRGEVKEVLLSPTEIRGLVVRRAKKRDVPATSPKTRKPKPGNPRSARVPPRGVSEGSSRRGSALSHPSRRDPLHELSLHVNDLSHLPPRFLFRTVRVEDSHLVEQLESAGVRFAGVRPSALRQFFWAWILPLLVMGAVWFGIMQVMGKTGQQVMSFGKSRAKIVADQSTGVTFDEVAGCDEAKHDLQELVQFLKDPKRYEELGARIPTGVLLVGPPGTGKTLLAKAVAGEAGVPFFSLSGSDFVEMFVGVGAARVRDLFEQAKQKAPCIVFIDEIDAIGRQRGVAVGAVNDEREQTLNQLLVEMDGFDANLGVIILAATNRPEVLDRALLRPGRFDRQVVVDTPDLEGRLAILQVHAKGKKLAPEVDLRRIAQATVGFSGADLANTLNEAALLTARRGGDTVTQADLEEAVERVVAGPERKSRRLNEEEKRRVAYHEVGHALVAAFSEHADPVHKISIVPRGRAALGYTLQLPTDDRFLVSYSELLDQLKGLLGGRAAEEVVFGEVSTGAQNDLERATAVARQMVSLYGMGSSAGLMHCVRQTAGEYLTASGSQLDCSDATAHAIDEEVKQILDQAYQEAVALLRERRPVLERVAAELLTRETLGENRFKALLEESTEDH